jgi:hypothetical protein
MADFKIIEQKVSKIQHGFREMREEALELTREETLPQSLRTARQLYSSEKYQVRMVAVFVLGFITPKVRRSIQVSTKHRQPRQILAGAGNPRASIQRIL